MTHLMEYEVTLKYQLNYKDGKKYNFWLALVLK